MNLNNMIVKELNKEKVLKLDPTLVGLAAGAGFYEDPIHGDEAPLIMIKGDLCARMNFWEMDDVFDFVDTMKTQEQGD